MIVEDHPFVRDGLSYWLSKQDGISVVATAKNGRDALQILNDNSIVDIVVTDLRMPVMDGFD